MAHAQRWALALSGVGALGYTIYVYAISPEVVPVHYGLRGPDRWGPRSEPLIIHAGIIGLVTLLFLALPELLRRTPASSINIPNKDYWLAPERLPVAIAKFAAWATTFGIAVNLMLVAMQAALAPWQGAQPQAPSPLPNFIILGFLAFALASCAWLVWAYRLPKSA